METFAPIETRTRRRQGSGARAFTLVELLVLLAMVAVLTAIAAASSATSRSQVMQMQCTGNLRQIGMGLSLYAAERNGYLPLCKYRDVNTWYTYEAARVTPGTSVVNEGFYNLGLLFRTKAVAEAKALYCPAQTFTTFTYDYYASNSNGWPSTPVAAMDDKVRTGYTYFPQRRITDQVGTNMLPRVVTALLPVEFGTCTAIVPAKLEEINPQKSVTTDVIANLNFVPHRAQDSLQGVNALFPDGTVVFQSVRKEPQQFAADLWSGIQNDGLKFRIVNNGWKP